MTITDVAAGNLVNVSNFNLITATPINVAAGATGIFDISFDVDALGAFSLDMAIDNNDTDEDPYDIQINGTGVNLPEMSVLGNDTMILDGLTTPGASNHTEFGSADTAGAVISRTFTIQNTGLADLNLTGGPPAVTISGTHAAEFTLINDAATPIPAGDETTFVIAFDPGATGLREATVSIDNDDGDENPYNFSIQGTGTGPVPEMDVLGNGISIPDGDSSPSTLDQTDFGDVGYPGGAVTYTFSIENTGSVDLNLTDTPIISIGGSHAADFTLTNDAVSPVTNSGGTTAFEITFMPSMTGLHQATVSIANDDSDENPYNFDIQGNGNSSSGDSSVQHASMRKFTVGQSGGNFQSRNVLVVVENDSVANGSQLIIKKLAEDSNAAKNFKLGDMIFDITFKDNNGSTMQTFSPPIEVCIMPSRCTKKSGRQ